MKRRHQIFLLIASILLMVNLSSCSAGQNTSDPSPKTVISGNEGVLHEPETSDFHGTEPAPNVTVPKHNDKEILFRKMLALESDQALAPSEKTGLWIQYIGQFYLADSKLISSQDDVSSIHEKNDIQIDINDQIATDKLRFPAPTSAEFASDLNSLSRSKLTKYYAYVPLVPDSTTRFPVLFLLHGAYDDYTSWPTHCREQLKAWAARYGIIIICPDGEPFGWYADSRSDSHSQIETYFVEELIPEIDGKFPVAPGKRAIAGLSMGGHGALVLALRHPHLFSSISSMSGILDITKHTKQWHLSDVFGPYEKYPNEWDEHSAYQLCAKDKGALIDFPIMVTVGLGDTLALADNREFNELLSKLSINHVYQEAEGNHDWKYWSSQLQQHIEFHVRNVNAQPETLSRKTTRMVLH